MRPNAKRKARLHREQFIGDLPGYDHAEEVRKMPCAACERQGPSEPHHVKSRGAGGKWGDIVPLCTFHHRFIHDHGSKGVEFEFMVNFAAFAERLHAKAIEENS